MSLKEMFPTTARKVSSLISIAVAVIVTIRNTTPQNETTVLTIWLSFEALCIGLITVEQLIKFKSGKID